jgi:hypothetical protein
MSAQGSFGLAQFRNERNADSHGCLRRSERRRRSKQYPHLVHHAITGVNSCYALYFPVSNTLYLETDTDNGMIGR